MRLHAPARRWLLDRLRQQGPATCGQLAAERGVALSTMGTILDRACMAGLVRVARPTHGRDGALWEVAG